MSEAEASNWKADFGRFSMFFAILWGFWLIADCFEHKFAAL